MNNQPPRNADKIARTERRRKVAKFLRQNITSCRMIGEELGVSHMTIHKDKTALLEKWRRDAADIAAEAFVCQLESIWWRRKELIEQWERSKQDATYETTDGKGGSRSQCGDTSYMAELRALDEREDKLLALTKDDSRNEIIRDDWRRATPELLRERYRKRLADLMPRNQENGE